MGRLKDIKKLVILSTQWYGHLLFIDDSMIFL
jgi:hypothetical protein